MSACQIIREVAWIIQSLKNPKFAIAAVLSKDHILITGVKGLKGRRVLTAGTKWNL